MNVLYFSDTRINNISLSRIVSRSVRDRSQKCYHEEDEELVRMFHAIKFTDRMLPLELILERPKLIYCYCSEIAAAPL